MASKPVNTPASADDEWETIAEARTRMVFDTDGDMWEGFYEGPDTITDPNTAEVYEYLNFRDANGDPYMCSASYQLKRALADTKLGTYVRITRINTTAVKHGNMINFKVQQQRNMINFKAQQPRR